MANRILINPEDMPWHLFVFDNDSRARIYEFETREAAHDYAIERGLQNYWIGQFREMTVYLNQPDTTGEKRLDRE